MTRHVMLVLDESSSIHSCGMTEEIRSSTNDQIQAAKEASEKGEDVRVWVVTFGDRVRFLYEDLPAQDVPEISDQYRPGGMTALNDGMGLAARRVSGAMDAARTERENALKAAQDAKDEELSAKLARELEEGDKALVVVMTDGEENNSQEFRDKRKLAALMKEFQDAGHVLTLQGCDQNYLENFAAEVNLGKGAIGVYNMTKGSNACRSAGTMNVVSNFAAGVNLNSADVYNTGGVVWNATGDPPAEGEQKVDAEGNVQIGLGEAVAGSDASNQE